MCYLGRGASNTYGKTDWSQTQVTAIFLNLNITAEFVKCCSSYYLNHDEEANYPSVPGALFTSAPHTVPPKPLAALPQNHHRNN